MSIEGVTCGITLLVMIAIVVVAVSYAYSEADKQQKAQQKAHEAFHASLESLKAAPTDPDLKEETLRLGREYSNLTRDEEGVALFDEVALMNDISAACAAATKSASVASEKGSVQERLQALSALRAKGLIDETEFETKRIQILEEL